MKKILYVDHEQLANIRKQALADEVMGIDPGAYWKYVHPEATEIEFVVQSSDNGGPERG